VVAQMFGLLFFPVKLVYQFWLKNDSCYILGDLFANSSGHPGANPTIFKFTLQHQRCSRLERF
jgi:hypothetical protein